MTSLQNQLPDKDIISEQYWPVKIAELLSEGKYSKVVEICNKRFAENDAPLSARIILAQALYKAGQFQASKEQIYDILSKDSNCLTALKLLGDIENEAGEEIASRAAYEKILQIDPYCRGVVSLLSEKKIERTHTITLKRVAEETEIKSRPMRDIPFHTETAGDLYLAQGHNRLAAEVFKSLLVKNENPRLIEKLKKAELKSEKKEQGHVS